MKQEKEEKKISIKDRIALKITSSKTVALIYCNALLLGLRIAGDISGDKLSNDTVKVTIAYFTVNFAQKAIQFGRDYYNKRFGNENDK
ncbi:hypothetical protein KAR91_79730 [Candidatus Pacearchaeota archaeon]|nr:hypothetical protein [Candidatus Pacearchaeota archaeon]